MVQRPCPDLRGGCAAMRIPTVTGGRGSVTTPPTRPKHPLPNRSHCQSSRNGNRRPTPEGYSPSRFLSNQATGRCKPFRIRQLARAALERQRPPRGEPHGGGTPSQRACTGVERSAPRRDRASTAPAPETAHPRTGAGPCDPPMPPGNLPGSGGSATPRYRSRRPCPPEPGPQPARRCRPRAPRTAPSAGSRCRAPDRCRWRSRAASLRTRTRTTRRPGPRASGASRGCSRGRRPTARSRSPACR